MRFSTIASVAILAVATAALAQVGTPEQQKPPPPANNMANETMANETMPPRETVPDNSVEANTRANETTMPDNRRRETSKPPG